MTTNQPLSLFISSNTEELAQERQAVQAALSDYHLYGWLWENDAGARPFALRSTYLDELAVCDIYIGIFWLGYSSYTIAEFEQARSKNMPCLLYTKDIDIENRDPQLMQFLKRIAKINNPDSLVTRRFTDPEELASFVEQDVVRLLTDIFRESHDQPMTAPAVLDQHGNMLGRTLTILEQVELTDKLLNCGAISDRSLRDRVLAMLPPAIQQRIIRGNTDITDVLQIVKKSSEYDDGIEKLLVATRSVDGDTRSVRAIVAYLRKLGFPLL